jgi:hypothetical protein
MSSFSSVVDNGGMRHESTRTSDGLYVLPRVGRPSFRDPGVPRCELPGTRTTVGTTRRALQMPPWAASLILHGLKLARQSRQATLHNSVRSPPLARTTTSAADTTTRRQVRDAHGTAHDDPRFDLIQALCMLRTTVDRRPFGHDRQTQDSINPPVHLRHRHGRTMPLLSSEAPWSQRSTASTACQLRSTADVTTACSPVPALTWTPHRATTQSLSSQPRNASRLRVDSPRLRRQSHSLRIEVAKPSSRIVLKDSSA